MSPLIINRRARFSYHFVLLDVQNIFLLMFISVNKDKVSVTNFTGEEFGTYQLKK